jgi:hypothetical protein
MLVIARDSRVLRVSIDGTARTAGSDRINASQLPTPRDRDGTGRDATMPERIQLRRTRGWRKPENAVVVARPTKWGNPYRLAPRSDGLMLVDRDGNEYPLGRGEDWRAAAVRRFRDDLLANRLDFDRAAVVHELAGRDLACWCALDQRCHADVLIEIANSL